MISAVYKQISRRSKGEEGQALIIAIMFLIALTFLGLGLIMLSSIDIHSSRNLRMAGKALSAAEEGVVVGMAFAADPDSEFNNALKGTQQHLVSTNFKSVTAELQYEVDVFMEGEALPPPGWEMAYYGDYSPATFNQIFIRSQGYVLGPGESFDPNNPPHIQNTVILRTRVGSFGE